MMQIKCGSDARRSEVKDNPKMNGIDYLEIHTVKLAEKVYSKPLIIVHCFRPVTGLTADNVLIKGGTRIQNVKAEWAHTASDLLSPPDNNKISSQESPIINVIENKENTLVIRSSSLGDFSTYELMLVKSRDDPGIPPENFDAVLSRTEFSFKVECPSDFDCTCKEEPQKTLEEIPVDYMAKDYTSFRKLMLDRMSLIMPDWKERNPADIGIMLVELFAYIGDHLSYYQDAVGTEAYLGTARKRTSTLRHARLLDYPVHNGCNARTWICVQAKQDATLPAKTVLLTGTEENNDTIVKVDDVELEVTKGAEAFETMYEIPLYKSKNEMSFYTWGETYCWLPTGSTSATLENTLDDVEVFVWENILNKNVSDNDDDKLIDYLARNFALDWLSRADITKNADDNEICIKFKNDNLTITKAGDKAILVINGIKTYEFKVLQKATKHVVKSSCLRVGDVIIFGEKEPASGDASPLSNCHAVLLTSVTTNIDELNKRKVIEIGWSQDDSLPFSLCLQKEGKSVSTVYGNVVLADHGYTKSEHLENVIESGKYYPSLSRKLLTHRGHDFEIMTGSGGSAASAFDYNVDEIKPDIYLTKDSKIWQPQRDLLSSDEFAREFVVEMETDGTAYIRFSNDNREEWVSQISAGRFTPFIATYRIGNGVRGNVGSYSIKRILFRGGKVTGDTIDKVFNPMAASGGKEPETMNSIRFHAPQAFRKQERAVTESDYEDVLKRHPQVQKAAVMKRWTGSWYTMFITIDRVGGLPINSDFEFEIVKFLEKYRLAGYDVEIQEPAYIPLKITLDICLKKGYFVGEVKEKLFKTFSNMVLEDGRKGFFHPDNFTFGQPLYLSKVYEAAMGVDGISAVIVNTFQRWGKTDNKELESGVIKVGGAEVIRLDNDPNFAEHGIIDFNFCGGM